LEANSEEREFESEHQDVPEEEVAVESFGALKERCGDRHLAVGYRRTQAMVDPGISWWSPADR
jgi:hypothetical protein